MGTLQEQFARAEVADLSGPAVYGRGVGYLRQGRVALRTVGDQRVLATVRGSTPYEVELWVDGDQPEWSCTCPFAEDGSFCKHAVAVALLLHEDASHGAATLSLDAPDAPEPDQPDGLEPDADMLLAEFVDGLDRDQLTALVMEAADQDWRLRERLLAQATAARGDGPELTRWRRRIDAVFSPYDDFVGYHEAADWAAEVGEVIDALAELCDSGHPAAVVGLAERAHRNADAAIGYVDGSDGWLTDISARLAALHLQACRQAMPDPVQLAARLADLELTSELDGFHRAAATYAEVLGPAGLAAYRRVVEPRWEAVQDRSESWSTERFTVREAMVGLAQAERDPDTLIEVYRHDLRIPDTYLEIARVLVEAGRHDEAERWAREGLTAFPDRPWQTPPLREFLAALLRQRGDGAAAVALFWEAFVGVPSLEAYRRLVAEAGEEVDLLGTRAVDVLSDRLGDHDRAAQRGGDRAGQVLVEILAYEGKTERAWQVATDHGCDHRMWLALARAREDTHPLDAIGVYEPEVLSLIERKQNATYRQAVQLLGRIRRLAAQAGQPDRFDDLLRRVRTEHGRKRNLVALLDQQGW